VGEVALLSFIGRQEHDYHEVAYSFPSGTRRTARYFGHALLEELRASPKAAPSIWIVIGTPTSGWDQLRFCVAPDSPRARDSEDIATEMLVTLGESRSATQSQLDRMAALLSAELGITVHLVATTDDGEDLFAVLRAMLPADAEVEADITHGFRTMPLQAMIALGALRWINGIRIRGIHYGKLAPRTESRPQQRTQPEVPRGPKHGEAQRLESMSLMAQATPALASLHLRGDVRDISHALERIPGCSTVGESLRAGQRLEDLMQYDASASQIGQAKGPLRTALGSPALARGFLRACTECTLDTLDSARSHSGSRGLAERSRIALKRSDYLRATALAYEALLKCVIQSGELHTRAARGRAPGDGPNTDAITELAKSELRAMCALPGAPRFGFEKEHLSSKDALDTLRRCRNSTIHALPGPEQGGRHDVGKFIKSERHLEALIEWAHDMHDFILPPRQDDARPA
jgi:hypothetical protein